MSLPDRGKSDAAGEDRGAGATFQGAEPSTKRRGHCNPGPRARRAPAWLVAEVELGLGLLLAADLPGAPGKKRVADLVTRWAVFIVRRRRPDHSDFIRIRTAFERLARTARRWPTVDDLLAALPPLPYRPPPPLPSGQRSAAGDTALATAAAILGATARRGCE